LSLAQALSGFTRDAAFAGFAEGRIGALEPGRWADFIFVDRDPASATAQDLARTKVIETWVGGRRAWQTPASATVLPVR
jgi:predicted amidohydrolase YtcJ